MAKDYARRFYSSKRWQNCRNEYAHKRKYLCEQCLKNGIMKAGVIVHHVNELTPYNIEIPEVTLNEDNLMLLCRDCHAKIHDQKKPRKKRRYFFGDNGKVITCDTLSCAADPIRNGKRLDN